MYIVKLGVKGYTSRKGVKGYTSRKARNWLLSHFKFWQNWAIFPSKISSILWFQFGWYFHLELVFIHWFQFLLLYKCPFSTPWVHLSHTLGASIPHPECIYPTPWVHLSHTLGASFPTPWVHLSHTLGPWVHLYHTLGASIPHPGCIYPTPWVHLSHTLGASIPHQYSRRYDSSQSQ